MIERHANARIILILALGIICAGDPNARSEENIPTDEVSKVLFDPRAESEMDVMATNNEVAQFAGTLEGDWTLFVEDRSHSIRRNTGLPKRWLADLPGHTGSFKAAAQPGEFYVFQIGVFAAKSATGDLAVKFGNLRGSAGGIESSRLRCLSLGGTNYLGQPLNKQVCVPAGKLQALWIGVDVPKTAAGLYEGTVTVTDKGTGISREVGLKLTVTGAVLEDTATRIRGGCPGCAGWIRRLAWTTTG